ncbi:MAG: ATP-binding cassette domain-containing protein [Merdimonas faecis]|uniref:ATP-binding cassette domain-containing protein n=1 Tax=Merdimonas faecis TaxID=1653435 RepID=UPI0022E60542|nr:ABC transporter ATP-binding protein [Merdimonas faecis]MBS5430788.1 ABC transporter ATP-binding protein [Lachnospiraceae bacterium]
MKGIEVKNVTKTFQDTTALSQVSLNLEAGKIYGLLGRNGAGKSTLLNLITNRKFPDEGTITLDGATVAENDALLQQVFLINEQNLFPEGMKVKKAFQVTKLFHPSFDEEYALQLCKKFELNTKKKIKSLSTGYQSIFKNILALSVNVPYVFFDEPVLGLDAYHRDLFYKLLIEKYSISPFTAVISTHLIEEVATVIENVIIIKKGTIIKNQSCEELLSSGYCISGTASQIDSYLSSYGSSQELIGTDSIGGLKTAYLLGTPDSSAVSGLEVSQMDLQKLFIQLTNP